MMEDGDRGMKVCAACSRSIPADAAFCKYCGTPQPDHEDEESLRQSRKWLRIVVAFYAIDLFVCTTVNFIGFFRGLYWLLLTEIVLGLLTLFFLVFVWKDIRAVLGFKSFTLPKAAVYGVAAVMFAVVVNFLVNLANVYIFEEDVFFYYSFGHLPYPKLAMLAMVALMPAVFEELAYRGIILEGLFKLIDEKQAIFISAFLFAVIHMSFISFFWLLPFAIWLGNVRWKEQTIWYGVLIHFCLMLRLVCWSFINLKYCKPQFWRKRFRILICNVYVLCAERLVPAVTVPLQTYFRFLQILKWPGMR
jgi:membrane protease YdiL (CAAX protease family)